jgi:hypothetical protein
MTEEQTEKIAWLNRAFHAEKAAMAWRAKLERDRSLAERISRTGDGTGGGQGNGTENALIRLAQTENETQERLRKLVEIREEISTAIRQVDDPDMQAILVRHYLAYETFETIADKMHYNERTIRRKHKKALDKVVL